MKRDRITNTSTLQATAKAAPHHEKLSSLPPLILVLAMMGAFIVMGATLPLYGLLFHTALFTQFGQWVLLPTHLLFPGWTLTPTLVSGADGSPPSIVLSWQQVPLLLGACLLLLIIYLVALRLLPRRVGRSYILYSTLLVGLVGALIPVVTSQDLFSYIIYARMAVIYHLNPLTTLPTAIQTDPVFQHLYWKDQPSAYGPTWVFISSILQQVTGGSVAVMVLTLRLLSLGAHLWSTRLIWSIGKSLQQYKAGSISERTLAQATLAFAWNPLLLFEACVNAHNDAVLLLFVLVALWLLVRGISRQRGSAIIQQEQGLQSTQSPGLPTVIAVAALLALATCLKINIVLFVPGLMIFLWMKLRRLRALAAMLAVYGGTILLLYVPFWQNGALLDILHTNPVTYRTINNLPEFLSHLYNSIARLLGAPGAPEIGSTSETTLHNLSIAFFIILYTCICWRALSLPYWPPKRKERELIPSPLALIRWMTLIWLLYCAIGTPWTWPWYLVTFFGLFALVEAADADNWATHPYLSMLKLPLTVRLLAFSMLSLYCFYAWGPFASFTPWLPDFRWAFWRGLWAWLLPCLAIMPHTLRMLTTKSAPTDAQH